MEYCQMGSLSDVMRINKKPFKQEQIKHHLFGILQALAYLHQNHIIHRDIKAANVLLMKDGEVKVADFGVSTVLSQTMMGRNTRTGSPFWMSPQLLSKSQYTFKTDIWSLGITAIQLAQGVPPYSHQHPYRAIFSIQSHPPHSLSQPKNWSRQFNQFVQKCLTLNESKRPSARQLLDDQFMKEMNTQKNNRKYEISVEPYIISKQQSNKCIKFQSPLQMNYMSNYDENSQISSGTVIINENISENCVIMKDNWFLQQKQDNFDQGTFKMNDKQVCQIDLQAIQTLKEQQNRNQNKKEESLNNLGKIQDLYAQMQNQMTKIRKKYMARIRQLQKYSLPSFQQSLNFQKASRIRTQYKSVKNTSIKQNIY